MLGVALSFALATSVSAQIRASERATVAQTIDGTVITVEYARPQGRGRRDLFGGRGKGVVHWGEMWTPGANWATTLEVNRPVRLNGQEVPAGKYSVWFVPQERAPWTVHLNRNPRLYHTQGPKPDAHFITVSTTPRREDHLDVLTFDFPQVTQSGATLRMRWGRTAMTLEIAVRPSRPAAGMAVETMAPYVGSYIATWSGDSTEMPIEVVAAGGILRAVVEGKFPFTWELIPTDEPHRFMPAFLDKGKVFDVEDAAPFIFELDGGHVTGFRVMGIDEVWMKGKRR